MNPESPERSLRVLVVEDAVDQALLVRSILEARGHVVRTAQDGRTALDLWDAESFDAVVTDLNLPGMDGVELSRELKTPERSAFVIAITAYEEGEYLDAARRAGVDHVLLKPFDPEDFVARLEGSTAEEPVRKPSGLTVLAVAARPGDAVFGCGGTLARHRQLGDEVLVFVASSGPRGGAAVACDRKAAEVLDVGIRFAESGDDSAVEIEGALNEVVGDLDPDIVYLPVAADYGAGRRDTHLQAMAATRSAGRVLGYLTPSSTLDFAPDTLKIVTPQMPAKLEAVRAFGELGDPALTVRFVKAAARWWGRSSGFAEVEPFEQIRR